MKKCAQEKKKKKIMKVMDLCGVTLLNMNIAKFKIKESSLVKLHPSSCSSSHSFIHAVLVLIHFRYFLVHNFSCNEWFYGVGPIAVKPA